MKILQIILIIGMLSLSALSATYRGKSIDGKRYNAEIYSYGTSKYYDVAVSFKGSDCTIHWSNGGRITIDLDDEDIEDPHDISAFDYKKATYYDIDLVDFK
jgi:hypothetical protein